MVYGLPEEIGNHTFTRMNHFLRYIMTVSDFDKVWLKMRSMERNEWLNPSDRWRALYDWVDAKRSADGK